jgi:hypothetical protein
METTPRRQARLNGPAPLACGLLLAAVVLSGWFLYTGQVWEDFLITLRHARNAAEGGGLGYDAGHPLHGFTSPLNVLLPALLLKLTGPLEPLQVLALYNVVAGACALLGLGFLLRPLLAPLSSRTQGLLLAFLIIGNPILCSFSMNGQEAAFTLCFLGLALGCILQDTTESWVGLGCALGGLLWTRPDFALLDFLLVSSVLLPFGSAQRPPLGKLLRACLLGVLLYLPWLIFAWLYFGTPIPNTITAKAHYTPTLAEGYRLLPELLRFLSCLLKVLPRPFLPAYAETGGSPQALSVLLSGFSLAGMLLWCVPRLSVRTRRSSWIFGCWMLYAAYLEFRGQAFPWYFPVACITGGLLVWLLGESGPRPLAWAGRLAMAGCLLYGLLGAARDMRLRQHYIEDGVRTQIGLWLRDHVKPGERIALEPIGYIGYYSGAKVLDYPGLVSPEVIQHLRQPGTNRWTLIDALKPEWLVLREPREIEQAALGAASFHDYVAVMHFEPSPEALPLAKDNPSWALRADALFTVYRRTPGK